MRNNVRSSLAYAEPKLSLGLMGRSPLAKTASAQPQVAALRRLVVVALTAGWFASNLLAGPTNAPAPTPAPETKSDTLVVQPPFIAPPVPQSAFALPKKMAEGRDPFYPKSTRVYGVDPSTTKTTKVAPVAELFLKGISGTDAEPLAIVNDVTFAPGEELDVMTKAGKMKIRCIEINKTAGTATIQVGGDRRQLHLPPLK